MSQHPNQASAVEQLQRFLRQLSYDHPQIPAPPIDGVYAARTREALNAFQQQYGLPLRDSADQATWELLYAAYLASLKANQAPESVSIFPRVPYDTVLSIGTVGFPVAAVQYMLCELSAKDSDLAFPEPSGAYTEDTARAVRVFQKKNFLSPSGTVDRVTWDAIARQHNTMAERYSPE